MIIRSPRPKRGYSIIDNRLLRDKSLSWKARGMLAYLLSMPDNWSVSIEHLAQQSPQGRHAVVTALGELETAGYVTRTRTTDQLGRIRWDTRVYDLPLFGPDPVQNPVETDDATAGLPSTENRGLLSNKEKKAGGGVISPRTHIYPADPSPLICSNCDGTGWSAGEISATLTRCHCPGGLAHAD